MKKCSLPTCSAHQSRMKWRFVIVFQIALVVGLLNPWSRSVSVAAATVLFVEVLLLVLVALPIFLYEMFIKKKKAAESFEIAIDTVLSNMWFTP